MGCCRHRLLRRLPREHRPGAARCQHTTCTLAHTLRAAGPPDRAGPSDQAQPGACRGASTARLPDDRSSVQARAAAQAQGRGQAASRPPAQQHAQAARPSATAAAAALSTLCAFSTPCRAARRQTCEDLSAAASSRSSPSAPASACCHPRSRCSVCCCGAEFKPVWQQGPSVPAVQTSLWRASSLRGRRHMQQRVWHSTQLCSPSRFSVGHPGNECDQVCACLSGNKTSCSGRLTPLRCADDEILRKLGGCPALQPGPVPPAEACSSDSTPPDDPDTEPAAPDPEPDNTASSSAAVKAAHLRWQSRPVQHQLQPSTAAFKPVTSSSPSQPGPRSTAAAPAPHAASTSSLACSVRPASAPPLQRCVEARNTFASAAEYQRHWERAVYEELNIRCWALLVQLSTPVALCSQCQHSRGAGRHGVRCKSSPLQD